MSRTAKISLFFGDGEYDFQLLIGQLIELQEKTGEGPGVTLARLSNGLFGQWKIETIKDTIRFGLIGAGMEKKEAWKIVERNVVAGYIVDSILVARTVLEAAIIGCEEEQVGESLGDSQTQSQASENPFPMENIDGPISLEPVQ